MKGFLGRWLEGDRLLLVAFTSIDLVLIGLAYYHFGSAERHAGESIRARQAEIELKEVQGLGSLADEGNWDAVEKARMAKIAHYLRTHQRPSPTMALYFYPETLPANTLEREFIRSEIRPALNELKASYAARNKTAADLAFARLQMRIRNYELGMKGDSKTLSREAYAFLRLYRKLLHFHH